MALAAAVADTLSRGKKTGKIQFGGCTPLIIKHWLGKFDGVTKNGKTCNLNFNDDYTTWDTGKPGSGKYAPTWLFYSITSDGTAKWLEKNGRDCRPFQWRFRNVGNTGKLEATWSYEIKIQNIWQPYR